MDRLPELKARLDALRPLSPDHIKLLWPQWRAEDALFVYATNAVEGSTLTLAETIVVLEEGVTVGGKPVRDHLDAINGQKAYSLMLDLAQQRAHVDLALILDLHRAVVGDVPYAGQLRDQPVYIRGSMHVPPNYAKVPRLMNELLEGLRSTPHVHPVAASSQMHFDLLTIHPFVDGNGRTARLLQNLYLIREGFVPVLIGPDEKMRYFDVLQRGQVAVPGIGDATEFIGYMAELERQQMERYLAALRTAHGDTPADSGGMS
ncbi:MAG TPA: Fic family protein [Candidatus Elarobacter sp.]|jgi:Fic family protein